MCNILTYTASGKKGVQIKIDMKKHCNNYFVNLFSSHGKPGGEKEREKKRVIEQKLHPTEHTQSTLYASKRGK